MRVGDPARRRAVVEGSRVRRVVPVRIDQRVSGQGLAAVQGDHRLALRHHRGREVVDDGRLAGNRHPGAERRGAAAALDCAERREDQAPAHVHHVDGGAARLRRTLGPVPDAAEVAGVLQRGDRHAVTARLLDPEVHRLLPDRLPEAVVAVDHRERLGLALDLDAPAREDLALSHPLHVAAGAEHSVRIVSAKIRAGEPPRDAVGLLGVAAGALEDGADEALHRGRIDMNLTVGAADRAAARIRAAARVRAAFHSRVLCDPCAAFHSRVLGDPRAALRSGAPGDPRAPAHPRASAIALAHAAL